MIPAAALLAFVCSCCSLRECFNKEVLHYLLLSAAFFLFLCLFFLLSFGFLVLQNLYTWLKQDDRLCAGFCYFIYLFIPEKDEELIFVWLVALPRFPQLCFFCVLLITVYRPITQGRRKRGGRNAPDFGSGFKNPIRTASRSAVGFFPMKPVHLFSAGVSNNQDSHQLWSGHWNINQKVTG